jgi:hypothetical protein
MKHESLKILNVVNSDELRDALPESGIFEMLDCSVELMCPPTAATSEIEKMVTIIESMINVTDVRVTGTPRSEDEQGYLVAISNVPTQTTRRRTRE